MNEIFLYPSNIIVSNKPNMIKTILGPCVAVCLFDEKNKIGGINHFMLPYWDGKDIPTPKYGNIAIKKLYEKLIMSGGDESHIISKIFGGANIIEKFNSSFEIGQQNLRITEEKLNDMNIPIKSKCVGGELGRMIIFDTNTGIVKRKYI